jgi:excinuclease ABC subunit C
VHRRESFISAFDGIPGIGPKRKRALLKKFGSVQAVREASLEEMAAASGMTEKLARKVKESL